ncbi:MAG: HAMP domain-containing histidine kinase [Candidatus Gastranaerophilales bacterium]|nr:HAMP domain-containing histidine kinase [Candidatus Gastranaerophilales bacterium]
MTNLKIKKEDYVAKIMHDLENPILAQINALRSFLDTAEKKIAQEEKDLIELTLNSCNYISRQIDIFNLVYRLNYEPISLNYETFNFGEIIDETLDEMKVLLKYSDLDYIFENDFDCFVKADKIQIKKIVQNLISNSVNYAFKGSLIKITLLKEANDLIFKVESNSPAICEDVLREVFQKSNIGMSLYSKFSIGLGLYLSKEIIKAHGGVMIAKSFPEDVNIFGFKLPI